MSGLKTNTVEDADLITIRTDCDGDAVIMFNIAIALAPTWSNHSGLSSTDEDKDCSKEGNTEVHDLLVSVFSRIGRTVL